MPFDLRLAFLLAALAGCRPNLPPVAGCAPGAASCVSDRPHICSATQRWEPAGTLDCRAVGGVCVVSDGGVPHCATAPDAGADAAEVTP